MQNRTGKVLVNSFTAFHLSVGYSITILMKYLKTYEMFFISRYRSHAKDQRWVQEESQHTTHQQDIYHSDLPHFSFVLAEHQSTVSWQRIRKRTSERSERVSFLIQKQRQRKYRTKHFPCCNLFISYLLRLQGCSVNRDLIKKLFRESWLKCIPWAKKCKRPWLWIVKRSRSLSKVEFVDEFHCIVIRFFPWP